MRKILVLGGTSDVAYSTLKHFAKDNDEFVLVGRNKDQLEAISNDLCVRGASAAHTCVYDFASKSGQSLLLDDAISKLGGVIDIALIAYGTLPNQEECQESIESMESAFYVNCVSIVAFVTLLANFFEKHKKGTIAVISSVAGDRGRKSNYVYGAAKGALSIFLGGVRNRLFPSNVNVLTIKPGFVSTKMTRDFKKGLLFASPDKVGEDIYHALINKKDILYTPWFWRIIMGVIKLIPEFVFKRTSI